MKKRIFAVIFIIVALAAGFYFSREAAGETKKKQYLFGATYMTMNNPYFPALNESIKEVIEGNGDILITRNPLQDQDKQNEQIADMIEEGIDLLFLNPVNLRGVKPAIKLCQENDIPIIVVDTNVLGEEEQEIILSIIVSDNYDAGVQCALDMMTRRSEAKIVVVNHPEINSTNMRVQGFKDTIADYPSYQVVDERVVTTELVPAMKEMQKVLYTDVEFDVVLGGNDPTALGCLAAMQMHRVNEDILIYGIDGSPAGKAMIKAGYLTGTAAQYPTQIGGTAASTAYSYLEGKPVEKKVIVPVSLITEKNLREFDVNGWQ